MRKFLCITCTAAALVAPAAASASSDGSQAHKDAVKTCKELRKAAGKANFASTYGKKGLGRCIKQESKENRGESRQANEQAQQNAASECKAERDADPAAFTTKYGSGKKGKNAYGKCVSQHAQQHEQEAAAAQEQAGQDQVSAARECRAERQADPAAFAAKYGTNGNKRDAFGKCVSTKAKAKGQAEQQS
jgi:hypothetical protein